MSLVPILTTMVSTGELLSISQSSILVPHVRPRASCRVRVSIPCCQAYSAASNDSLSLCFSKTRSLPGSLSTVARASVVPEVPTSFTANLPEESIEILPDNTGGGGKSGGSSGGEGGGGGGNNDDGGEEGADNSDNSKKMAMSMSQKLTLGYAALVGVGGLMGYLKSGSQKSLIAGGGSAVALYYVYTQLPTNPTFASCIGFGLSAALLGVMGSRFKNSGKVFPAGVVSIVSLIMTGGYLHGIMRGMH